MRPKSLFLLVLALGCGLVAAMGINQVLANRRAQNESAPGETQKIYVAMQDIEGRQAIDAQMIRLEDWPKDKVPAGAIADLEKVQGRFTRTKVYAGEPVLEFKLVDSDAGFSPTALIPDGMRVVAVKVDEVSSSSSLVLPGDRVDLVVFLTSNSASGIGESTAKTILQDIRVFAVNEQYREDIRSPEESNIAARTVSLLVTPEQAEVVTLASQLGQIRLTLRGRTDEQSVMTPGASPSEVLYGEASKSDRGQELALPSSEGSGNSNELLSLLNQQPDPTPAPTTPVAAPNQRVSRVTVISGSEVKEVELIDGKPVLASAGGEFSDAAPAADAPVLVEEEATDATGATPDPAAETEAEASPADEAAENRPPA